jgi:hypothetical protein
VDVNQPYDVNYIVLIARMFLTSEGKCNYHSASFLYTAFTDIKYKDCHQLKIDVLERSVAGGGSLVLLTSVNIEASSLDINIHHGLRTISYFLNFTFIKSITHKLQVRSDHSRCNQY